MIRVALLIGALATAASAADTPEQRAEKVLAAVRDKDAAALKKLASLRHRGCPRPDGTRASSSTHVGNSLR